MFVIKENEREYRFGDSGPKYLMRGPRSNFAVVKFNPGQDFPAHYHEIMEENFYVLEGKSEESLWWTYCYGINISAFSRNR